MRRSIWLVLLVAVLSAEGALAQPYPARPVRFIVPYPPGGATDILSRSLGRKLSAALGQQFIIENRAGGGQIIGTDIVAKAPADGYTILLASVTHSINPGLQPSLPYDSFKDFAPISLVAQSPNVLVVHPAVAAKSIKELIALAKARPGALNCATSGVGSGGHLAGELFKSLAGIELTFVPYKGGGPAYVDLMGGQADLMFTSPNPTLSYAKAGKLRALAMTGSTRSAAAPELPTVAEAAGFPGYQAYLWYGILAPARTPREIITRLHAEIIKALQAPDLRDPLVAEAVEIVGSTPEEFAKHLQTEAAKWLKVIKGANIRLANQ